MIKKYFQIKFSVPTICLAIIIAFTGCDSEYNHDKLPQPITTVKADMEEEGKSDQRRAWIEDLHRCEEGVDWRTVEYQTAIEKSQRRSEALKHRGLRSGDEVLADGQLMGRWRERGSSNQAGSVIATHYNASEDKIYTISAGGSLFKSTPDGLDWEVVNDRLRFNGSLLNFVGSSPDERLVALINRIPHYSNDNGESWQTSQGISINDRWGNTFSPIVHNSKVFVLSKPDYWSPLTIYMSADNGSSYAAIQQLSSHDAANYHLFSPHHNDALFFIERTDTLSFKIHQFNDTLNQFDEVISSSSVGFGTARCNMAGTVRNGNLELIIYNGKNEVIKSIDQGLSWTTIGQLPASPWGVGIYITPSDPDVMLMGAVECHRSTNGGQSWNTINKWWDYYGDVVNKLHADIMYFNEFIDNEGDPALLISNHGGLSISRNGGATNLNIGLYGLNVSQYYSVRTDPLDSDLIYTGTQDQGLQRGRKDNADWVDFDQVISGDYGHISFTENDSHMWCVYPGGWISYYQNPHFESSPTLSYEIDSEHEAVWIPPIIAHPNPQKNAVYAAGGNIDGGEGSFLISLEVINGSIITDQLDYDFRAHTSNGSVASMAFSPLDSNRLYVATNNGYIFTSEDKGHTFTRGVLKVPGAHYLYGSSILPSKYDDQVVMVGGSGYSTSPVVRSDDGGRIFRPMSEGLPPTTVLQLASNEDESMLFAATEAGPYVFIAAEEKWYDMSGLAAPNQTYWSVEFLDDENVARFGTYGRGIWDFEIEELNTPTQSVSENYTALYPNPAIDFIRLKSEHDFEYQIMDINGKTVGQGRVENEEMIDISTLLTGTYFLLTNEFTYHFIKI
jgi:photosystem II stability/assembly factor-like uncharacterized protein